MAVVASTFYVVSCVWEVVKEGGGAGPVQLAQGLQLLMIKLCLWDEKLEVVVVVQPNIKSKLGFSPKMFITKAVNLAMLCFISSLSLSSFSYLSINIWGSGSS